MTTPYHIACAHYADVLYHTWHFAHNVTCDVNTDIQNQAPACKTLGSVVAAKTDINGRGFTVKDARPHSTMLLPTKIWYRVDSRTSLDSEIIKA